MPVGGNLNLVSVGWGIWTGSVKSFQPNKRVLAEEFKDRATTLRGDTEETKRNSYIPFNSLVHIALFLSLSVKISMKGCLRSSLAWRVFVSQNLMYYISDELHVLSSEQKKVSSWLTLFWGKRIILLVDEIHYPLRKLHVCLSNYGKKVYVHDY